MQNRGQQGRIIGLQHLGLIPRRWRLSRRQSHRFKEFFVLLAAVAGAPKPAKCVGVMREVLALDPARLCISHPAEMPAQIPAGFAVLADVHYGPCIVVVAAYLRWCGLMEVGFHGQEHTTVPGRWFTGESIMNTQICPPL